MAKSIVPHLSDKQKRFADEYLICLNGREAYQKIYKIKSGDVADAAASRLLANVKVSEYVHLKRKELDRKMEIKTEITQERILKEYARIAFFDPRKLFDENDNLKKITDLDDETAAAIAGIDISAAYGKNKEEAIIEIVKKLKLVDKKGSLDSLAKIKGMFKDEILVSMTFEDYLKAKKANQPQNEINP